MPEIRFSYRPMEVYRPFHQSSAPERLMVGGFGSGKTYSLCADAVAFGLEQPGSRILLTRKTAPELRDTLEPVFLEVLPDELYSHSEERRSGGHIESLTLPNGTKFLFRSIDDWRKHKSLNLAAIFWDELSEFDFETYMAMRGRLRQRELTSEARRAGLTGEITRRTCAAATNPEGHNWLWERFVQDKESGTAYWKATTLDNPYLPVDYVESLLAYPEPWVKRYVLCSFDDFGGRIYPEWAWDTHVLRQKLRLDASSICWMGMDPGTRNPTAGLWVVVDKPNNRLVGVAEYEQNDRAAADHVATWRQVERKLPPVKWRVSDPNALPVKDRGSNMSLEDQYRRLGFSFQLGPSRHKHRIPMLGQLIKARRFVLLPSCPKTFQSIQEYQWRDLTPTQRQRGENPPEEPLKKNDHLVDCAQYLSSRWVRPIEPGRAREVVLSERERRDLEIQRTIRKQMLERQFATPTSEMGHV